jgi:hypothetical protein
MCWVILLGKIKSVSFKGPEIEHCKENLNVDTTNRGDISLGRITRLLNKVSAWEDQAHSLRSEPRQHDADHQ